MRWTFRWSMSARTASSAEWFEWMSLMIAVRTEGPEGAGY